MALMDITHRFETIGGQSRFSVILPETGSLKDVPVVLLLHGASDNGSGWLRFTSAERYAFEKRVALIIPSVNNSYYADMESGPQYFSFITQELRSECRRLFGLSLRREDNYVIGLSMGGYGALKCALRYPAHYTACASFSAAVRPELVIPSDAWPLEAASGRAIFGDSFMQGHMPPSGDLYTLAQQSLDSGERLPFLYLTCGEQDTLYDMNAAWHEFLTEKNIPHTFHSSPGSHNWGYWDAQLKLALDVFFQ